MKSPLALILCTAALLCACHDRPLFEKAKVLGSREFTQSAWKHGDQLARGEMLASFLKKYDAEKLTAKEVEALLGPPTAYYDYDEFPAYIVGPTSVHSNYGNGYVVAFVTDRKSNQIARIEIVPEIE